MKYPVTTNKTIYITAASNGVGHKLESFDESLAILRKEGFETIETPSVRNNQNPSADKYTRAKELNSCFEQDDNAIVAIAAGGDFLLDTLPLVDFETMQRHPKWLIGASDPTTLLYTLTVKYGIATLYGFNAGSFNYEHLNDPYMQVGLSYLHNNFIDQTSSTKHAPYAHFMDAYNGFDTITKWESSTNSDMHVRGRVIGGCIDALKDIIGTQFDKTASFNDTYYEDGIILYFDNFAMSIENLYRTLLQMKYSGWFNHVKLVIFGRNLFTSSETNTMTYLDAYKQALEDIPFIYNADIGHTEPCMTIINGAMMDIELKKNKAKIHFDLV